MIKTHVLLVGHHHHPYTPLLLRAAHSLLLTHNK